MFEDLKEMLKTKSGRSRNIPDCYNVLLNEPETTSQQIANILVERQKQKYHFPRMNDMGINLFAAVDVIEAIIEIHKKEILSFSEEADRHLQSKSGE